MMRGTARKGWLMHEYENENESESGKEERIGV
jgi:hypothetical protein